MSTRHPRPRSGTWRPTCEPLDGRVLPSGLGPGPGTTPIDAAGVDALGPYLTILDATPAPGAELDAAGVALRVRFDRPLDEFAIDGALRLDRMGAGVAVETTALAAALDPDDPCVLVLDPVAPLVPGAYRLVLAPDSLLMAADGTQPEPGGADRVVTTFAVAAPAAAPTDLGTLDDAERAVPGALDLAAAPGATALYRVRLGPAHARWRLGLEVAAGREGSALRPVLALFTADGRLLRTGGTGRADAPDDPFLFAGLPAGTYLVGVSGAGNVPGTAGGYDPASGRAGRADATAGTGAFTLRLVAEPAEAATAVLGARLDFADPRSAAPTGLALQFSGPMNLSDAAPADRAALELVDGAGQAWPVHLGHYDEGSLRLDAVLGRRLPAGTYELRLTPGGGLVDLAGNAPVRSGLPDGVLARFRVEADAAPADVLDLGALYLDEAADGIAREVTLAPGGAAAVRMVVLRGGFVRFALDAPAGAVAARLVPEGGGDAIPLEGPVDRVALAPGVYVLHLANAGLDPVAAGLTVSVPRENAESLLPNGLGQGPALNLRLAAPAGGLGGPAFPVTTAPAANPGPAATAPAPWSPAALVALVPGPVGVPVTGTPGYDAPAAAPASALGAGGLALGLNVEVMGLPAGGPAAGLGSAAPAATAAASAGPTGPGQGGSATTVAAPFPDVVAATAPATAPPATPGPADVLPASPTAGASGGDEARVAVLAAGDRHEGTLGRLLASLLFGAEEAPLDDAAPEAARADLPLLAGVDDLGTEPEPEDARAGVADPGFALLAAAVVTIQFRDGLRRRLGFRPRRVPSRPLPSRWGPDPMPR